MLLEASKNEAQATNRPRKGAMESFRAHWPEYLMEAWGLGMFMLSACVFGVLLEHPSSPWRQLIDDAIVRRALMGIAMGLTAVALICSPWGKRSGAHMNPAFTFAFFTLGKIEPWDAFFYMAFQFIGGAAGVMAASAIVGPPLAHSSVNYVITVPGPMGVLPAFLAETLISAGLMAMVLITTNNARLAKFTPVFAGLLLAVYITWEAPVSGMSLNPARTAASALPAQEWVGWWVYFIAPPFGMLLASALYVGSHGTRKVYCAKLHHRNHQRCIFRCNHGAMNATD